jgi:hypothetical protein
VGAKAGEECINYYCNAYIPYGMKKSENLNSPEECTACVKAGESTPCLLQYEQPDGSMQVACTEGNVAITTSALRLAGSFAPPLKMALESNDVNIASNSTVDCFSPAGGSYQEVTDVNGHATIPCSTDDAWYCVCHNKVGNPLYISPATNVTSSCSTEASETRVEIPMDYITTVPEGKSQTIDSSQRALIELSDNFAFECDEGALAEAGKTVTVSVDTVVPPFMANKIPVNYGYFVQALLLDSNGGTTPITQLRGTCTFHMPCKKSDLERYGLTENGITCSYYDNTRGAYSTITTSTVSCASDDPKENHISYSVNHLTDFAIVGNGFLGAIQGGDEGSLGKEEAQEAQEEGAGANRAAIGGCGGCYTGGGGLPFLDDRILWAIAILLLGLRGRLRPRPSRKDNQ